MRNSVITRVSLLLSVLLIAVAASGQTSPVGTMPAVAVTPAPTAPVYPSYFVSFGGGYTRNAAPQAAEGFLSTAIGLGGGNYSITTIDMTSATSTIRTGFGRIFAQSGNFTLMARVDAGISTVAPVIGSFAGGATVLYDLGGVSKKLTGIYAFGEVRLTGASTTTVASPNQVTPGFFFGVGKAF